MSSNITFMDGERTSNQIETWHYRQQGDREHAWYGKTFRTTAHFQTPSDGHGVKLTGR